MDPIKAAKLATDVNDALDGLAQCITEFERLWAFTEEMHIRLLYVMEKITMVHTEPSPILDVPPKVTRQSLTQLFVVERESFLARIADARTKLAAFQSGAHLQTHDDAPTAPSSPFGQKAGEGPRRGPRELVG